MPINPDVVGSTSAPVERSWSSTDCLLYALGVGAGAPDGGDAELEFTTENSTDRPQRVLPTFATVIGGGARRARASAPSTWPCSCTASRRSSCAAPIPTDGEHPHHEHRHRHLRQGLGRGGGHRVHLGRRRVRRSAVSATASLFIRGEGDFGGERGPSSQAAPIPERSPRSSGDPTRRARTRRFCTGSRATAIPCTRIPYSPTGRLRPPDPARVVHLRLHRAGPCSTRCAGPIRRVSAP